MLSIYFGDMPDVVWHPPTYFDNKYKDEWITNELSKKMILDIDKSTVIGPRLIDSPILGPIGPRDLSGGVKTLMLMAFDNSGEIFNATSCGENCAKWILEIAKYKDLTINLRYTMEFEQDEFEIKILNTGEVVHNMKEYLIASGKAIYGEYEG